MTRVQPKNQFWVMNPNKVENNPSDKPNSVETFSTTEETESKILEKVLSADKQIKNTPRQTLILEVKPWAVTTPHTEFVKILLW